MACTALVAGQRRVLLASGLCCRGCTPHARSRLALRPRGRSDSSEDAWEVEVDDWTYSEEFREQQLIDAVEQVLVA